MSTLAGRTNSTVTLWDPLACKTAWPVNRDCDGFNIFQGQSRTQNSKRRPVMLLISILDSCWLHHPFGLQHETSSYMSHYVHTCWRVIKKIWWIDYNHRMTMQINAGCDLHISFVSWKPWWNVWAVLDSAKRFVSVTSITASISQPINCNVVINVNA